jgi:hypothetical protein
VALYTWWAVSAPREAMLIVGPRQTGTTHQGFRASIVALHCTVAEACGPETALGHGAAACLLKSLVLLLGRHAAHMALILRAYSKESGRGHCMLWSGADDRARSLLTNA